jgi:adenylylsulfate reductase subunit A
LLEKGLQLLGYLREDTEKIAAQGLHELMRAWENVHRLWQAEAHIRTILFREETRWPGYYFRTDFPTMQEDWKCFANCRWDPKSGEWTMMKKKIIDLA